MIKLNLKRIIKIKGIESPTQYLHKRGYSATYTRSLIRGTVASISFERLEQMCLDWNCTPNDLLEYLPQGKILPQDHALQSLVKTESITEINKILHELPMEKIQQLYAILKEEKEATQTTS